MDRPDFATWLRYAGLPPPPQELVDDLRRRCAVYVLRHGGDPGTAWNVALPDGGMLTAYDRWIFDREASSPWAVQVVRMHLGRFENDPETWLGLGMRAWLPLSMIPRHMIDRWGAQNISGEACVASVSRETVEFELTQHQAVIVKMTGAQAVQALRTDQILLAPRPAMVAEW